jgi:hypothetical protein
MTTRDVLLVLGALLVVVVAWLGWRRGRRLRVLFDAVRELDFASLASYRHGRLEEVPLAERATTQRDGGVAVTVAVLSARESRALFGTDLARSGIQPVWLEVENGEEVPYWLLSAGLDPDYFSAREAAYMRHTLFAPSANRQMDEFFDQLQFRSPVLPGTTVSGFVFSNLEEGTKPVTVDLIAPRHGAAKSFTYFVPVPGLETDSSRRDIEGTYPPDAIVPLETEAELRRALEQLPGWTANKSGSARGDPLNLVLIGRRDDLFPAFLRRAWHPTEAISLASSWKTAKAFLLGSRYRYSPVSSLYALGAIPGRRRPEGASVHQPAQPRQALAHPPGVPGQVGLAGADQPGHRRALDPQDLEPHHPQDRPRRGRGAARADPGPALLPVADPVRLREGAGGGAGDPATPEPHRRPVLHRWAAGGPAVRAAAGRAGRDRGLRVGAPGGRHAAAWHHVISATITGPQAVSRMFPTA